MKKKGLLNNKGFVLAETLVVAVAVTVIFGIIFKHFYPLMGEYEIRERYDDIDSKYGTYWIKRMIQSNDFTLTDADKTEINNNGYVQFTCSRLADPIKQDTCRKLVERLEISCDLMSTGDKIEKCTDEATRPPHIYITKFRLVTKNEGAVTEDLKAKFEASTNVTESLKAYINYLPEYSKVESLNRAEYRIIIEYYRHRFDTLDYTNGAGVVDNTSYEVDTQNDFNTYSTIEVKK